MPRGEKGLIRWIADLFGVDEHLLSDAIHEEKRSAGRNVSYKGRQRAADLSPDEIRALAQRLSNDDAPERRRGRR